MMRIISSALLIVFPLSSYALDSDKHQPIQIESDSLHYDNAQKSSVYVGDVHFRQGTIHLSADKATVVNDSKGIKRLTAHGKPATFTQKLDDKTTVVAEASQLTYDADKRLIELTQNAKIQQNQDTFHAPKITYHLDKKQLNSSGGRTQILLHPKERSKEKIPTNG